MKHSQILCCFVPTFSSHVLWCSPYISFGLWGSGAGPIFSAFAKRHVGRWHSHDCHRSTAPWQPILTGQPEKQHHWLSYLSPGKQERLLLHNTLSTPTRGKCRIKTWLHAPRWVHLGLGWWNCQRWTGDVHGQIYLRAISCGVKCTPEYNQIPQGPPKDTPPTHNPTLGSNSVFAVLLLVWFKHSLTEGLMHKWYVKSVKVI